MPNCPECGSSLQVGDAFCEECGVSLQWPTDDTPTRDWATTPPAGTGSADPGTWGDSIPSEDRAGSTTFDPESEDGEDGIGRRRLVRSAALGVVAFGGGAIALGQLVEMVPGMEGATGTGGSPETSRSEELIRTFFDHLLEEDLEAANALVHPDAPMIEFTPGDVRFLSGGEFEIVFLSTVEKNDEAATVLMKYRLVAYRDSPNETEIELRKHDGEWRLWDGVPA